VQQTSFCKKNKTRQLTCGKISLMRLSSSKALWIWLNSEKRLRTTSLYPSYSQRGNLLLMFLHGNDYCFTVINKKIASLPATVVHSVNRFSGF